LITKEPGLSGSFSVNSVMVADTVLNKFSQDLIDRGQAGQPDSSLLLRTRWEWGVVTAVGWRNWSVFIL
jgi:hypothetical protein